jgi:hypothetical protein
MCERSASCAVLGQGAEVSESRAVARHMITQSQFDELLLTAETGVQWADLCLAASSSIVFRSGASGDSLDRVTGFVMDHPGFYAGSNENGTPIIQVVALQTQTGENWVEYSSVWSIKGARDVLGY